MGEKPERADRVGRLLGVAYLGVLVGFGAAGYASFVWDEATPKVRLLLTGVVTVASLVILIAITLLVRDVQRYRRRD